MKKILFIVGSTRKGSFNRQLAEVAKGLLEGRAEVSYLDFSALPFLNQDEEYPASDELARIRREIKEADGLWIFTPEYNSSYPGYLKNLIDWLSRPTIPNDYSSPVIIGKKIAISGVAGRSAAAGARGKLRELLTLVKAVVVEKETGGSLNREAFVSGTYSPDEATLLSLKEEAEALLAD